MATQYTPFATQGTPVTTGPEAERNRLLALQATLGNQSAMADADLRDRAAGREWQSGESAATRSGNLELAGSFGQRSEQDRIMEESRQAAARTLQEVSEGGATRRAEIGIMPQMGRLGMEQQQYGDTRADEEPLRTARKGMYGELFGQSQGGSTQGGGMLGNISPEQRSMMIMSVLNPNMAGPMMQQQSQQKALQFQMAQEDLQRAIEAGDEQGAQAAHARISMLSGMTETSPFKLSPAQRLGSGVQMAKGVQTYLDAVRPGALDEIVKVATKLGNRSATDQELSSLRSLITELIRGADAYGIPQKAVSDALNKAISAAVPQIHGYDPTQERGIGTTIGEIAGFNPLESKMQGIVGPRRAQIRALVGR